MQSVNSNLMNHTTGSVNTASKVAEANANTNGNTLPTNSADSVSISPQAKAMLEKEQNTTVADKSTTEQKEESVSKSVTSFAHGALGMDHPDDLEKQEDTSYSAGQYMSAAVTIGALILALA